MTITRSDIRLALPSKGRLEAETLDFLAQCGLRVEKPNPRHYVGRMPALAGLTVLFQRAGDIALSVRDGGVDLGITGYDGLAERVGADPRVLVLHDALGFGACRLALAVPEEWHDVIQLDDLRTRAAALGVVGSGLRVATKHPALVQAFLAQHGVQPFSLITAEGTLEVAPSVGYADCIADLVSTGTTLRDNRLRELGAGVIVHSQAVLIGQRAALQERAEVFAVAEQVLEYVEAHLRAKQYYVVIANIRGVSPEAIAERIFSQPALSGLQGPTISRVVLRGNADPNWYAITLLVRQDRLHPAIQQLRAIGGSGVVVSPTTYVFEEVPERCAALRKELSL